MPSGMIASQQKFVDTLLRLVGNDFAERRFLLAVSGGVDSMALLDLATRTLPASQLVVAHFHHGTRKSNDRDLALVRKAAEKAGVEFRSGSRKPSVGKVSELTLREARRAFLLRVRLETQCDFILTAHHLNDQFETLFMRLMRGTRARGLSGIREKNGAWLRPVLSLTKYDLESYAKARKLKWFDDETNEDASYLRNRVRHQVIPVFLQAAKGLGNEKQIFSRWNDTAKELARLTRRKSRVSKKLHRTTFWIRLSEADWDNSSNEEKCQLVETLNRESLTRPNLTRVLTAMEKRQKRFDLTGGIEGVFSCGQWFISTASQRRKFERHKEGFFEVCKGHQARLFQPGDRLGSTKLKKIFLQARIPGPERLLIPVILNNAGEVVDYFPKTTLVKCSFPFSFST